MTKKERPDKVDYRDSSTGKFVKSDDAKKHPRTTVKENNRPPSGKSRPNAVSDSVPPPKRKPRKDT